MNSDGRSTSQQLYIPTLLVIGACEDLEDRCLQAADESGLSLKACTVHDAPHAIPRRRPLAIVVPNGISDRMSRDLELLARDVRSVLLLVDPDVSARELQAMFSAAIAASSSRGERLFAAGRYSITDAVAEEAPFSRPGNALSRPSAPPPTRASMTPAPQSVRSPAMTPAPQSVRSPAMTPAPQSVRSPAMTPAPQSVRSPGMTPAPQSVRSPVLAPSTPAMRGPAMTPVPPSVRGPLTSRQTMPRVAVPGAAGQGGESVIASRAPGLASTRPTPVSVPLAAGDSTPPPGPVSMIAPRVAPRPAQGGLPGPTPPPGGPVRTATLPSMAAVDVASRPTPVPGSNRPTLPSASPSAFPSAEAESRRSISGIPDRLTEPPTSGTQPIERPSYAAIRTVFGGR